MFIIYYTLSVVVKCIHRYMNNIFHISKSVILYYFIWYVSPIWAIVNGMISQSFLTISQLAQGTIVVNGEFG